MIVRSTNLVAVDAAAPGSSAAEADLNNRRDTDDDMIELKIAVFIPETHICHPTKCTMKSGKGDFHNFCFNPG